MSAIDRKRDGLWSFQICTRTENSLISVNSWSDKNVTGELSLMLRDVITEFRSKYSRKKLR